jgi:imidazolonepropionase-like amidohydrolase
MVLLIDGDPLQDLNIILDDAKLQLVMKDGKIYKNSLSNP